MSRVNARGVGTAFVELPITGQMLSAGVARLIRLAPVTAHNDRMLLGPGPSNPYPEAMEALARPVLGHLDPEYLALMANISAQLKAVFGTTNELTLPVSGTGSAAWRPAW